jgi:hypothetical protein
VRPKIKLPYTAPEKLLQAGAALMLLAIIALTISSMTALPARIPTHFGFDGSPDGWGGKDALLLLPILSAVFYAGLTALERVPWVYNYPVEITEENAPGQYRVGRLMIEWMKLVVLAIYSYLQWQTTEGAKGLSHGLGAWFLPAAMVAMFGGMGVMIRKMTKLK